MVKFQHLIIPAFLWLILALIIATIPPTSLLVVVAVIIMFSLAVYTTLRFFTHSPVSYIATCCIIILLVSSIMSGFSLINLILIAAIGTLISLLSH